MSALFKHAIVMLAAWTVSGCATYEEPTSGPTAVLRLQGPIDYVSVGTKGRCGSASAVDVRQTPSIRVPAEQEVLVRFNPHGRHSSACVGDVFFTPREGRRYLLVAHASLTSCRAELRSSEDGQRWIEDTSYRTAPAPSSCFMGS